ncbi:hypothetical protein C1645_779570 [Glomus cerebriforme]|uniref:Uncharacterized protein n=1 Tax=Glomus cerebriforme TaxID=658196 RepID=A0A397SJX1_9GLOM|nr:hypothetical protein C1645_779570 [Glomus cerebriforme]
MLRSSCDNILIFFFVVRKSSVRMNIHYRRHYYNSLHQVLFLPSYYHNHFLFIEIF